MDDGQAQVDLLVTVVHRDDDGDGDEARLLEQAVQVLADAAVSLDQDVLLVAHQGDQQQDGQAEGTEESAVLHARSLRWENNQNESR